MRESASPVVFSGRAENVRFLRAFSSARHNLHRHGSEKNHRRRPGLPQTSPPPAGAKVFLLLFFQKKKPLTFFPETHFEIIRQ
jgi:hypothetical protein